MIPVSIWIPFASYHVNIVHKAIASAEAQTVKCEVHYRQSVQTPATFRNQAMDARTPFVVMLDADDTLEPNFVEECLRAYHDGHYVCTNWRCGRTELKPELCIRGGRSHLVTTLYPTAIFKSLGGFNPDLKGYEDVDFYMRSMQVGLCPLHLDKTLVNYTEHGQRSLSFKALPDNDIMMASIFRRHGGEETIMGCCGQPGSPAPNNPGEQQPGDVFAQTLWAGMRSEYSVSTGRVYRGGNGSKIWVHPEDLTLKAMNGQPLFKEVPDMSKLVPSRAQVLKESGLI